MHYSRNYNSFSSKLNSTAAQDAGGGIDIALASTVIGFNYAHYHTDGSHCEKIAHLY